MRTNFYKLMCSAALLLLTSVSMASSSKELIAQGNQYWQQNQVEQAETAYKKAIENAPEAAGAYKQLAGLYLSQNRSEEAISAYQNAIIHSPEDPKLFAALSIAYMHSGYYEMAMGMAERALELDPEMKNARDLRSYLEAKMDMVSKATAAYSGSTASAVTGSEK